MKLKFIPLLFALILFVGCSVEDVCIQGKDGKFQFSARKCDFKEEKLIINEHNNISEVNIMTEQNNFNLSQQDIKKLVIEEREARENEVRI